MKYRQTITDERKQQLLEVAIGKLRVILGERNPSVAHCSAVINEFMSHVVEDQTLWLRDATVLDLGLPLRTVNLLRAAGYENIQSLLGATAVELQREEGIGVALVEQIRDALAKRSLGLKGERLRRFG